MPNIIHTIKLGIVNCYLIQVNESFYLIDTGYAKQSNEVEKAIKKIGCKPGQLKLILLTHGDADHIGNAAGLKAIYGAQIAMHRADAKMAENGDESESRKDRPDQLSPLFRVIKRLGILSKQSKFIGFKPDIYLEDGQSLMDYGFDATVLSLPGHTKGSISITTKEGDLFCGDLMYNLPGFGYIDDLTQHKISIERLKKLEPRLIYPGHGKAFSLRSHLK